MTLAEKLLPKLSEWQPAGAGRHTWSETVADAGWNVHLAADKADSLSCQVWELTLTRTGDARAAYEMALKIDPFYRPARQRLAGKGVPASG